MKWQGIPCSWIGSMNIVKICTPLKQICRLNVILITIPMIFFMKLLKITTICMVMQKALKSHKDLEQKKGRTGRITSPDF